MISGNNPVINSTQPDALEALQTTLIISNTTAIEYLDSIYGNATAYDKSFNQQKVNNLLVAGMPKLIEFRLDLIRSNEPLRRPYPGTQPSETIYFLPFGRSSYNGATRKTEFCVEFEFDFVQLYTHVLANVIADKFHHLLFGLDALVHQVGVEDVKEIYLLISSLSEEGVRKLVDFSYAARSELIDTVVNNDKRKTLVERFPQISPAIQEVILNVNSSVPTHFAEANEAMKNVLFINHPIRQFIFQKLPIVEMAKIPVLARNLQRAAIMYSQNSYYRDPQVLRRVLMYDADPIQGFEAEVGLLREQFHNVFSHQVDQWLVGEAFTKTIVRLPMLPCALDIMNNTQTENSADCFDMKVQEKNIDELVRGFDALIQGRPVPQLNLTRPVAARAGNDDYSCYMPTMDKVGIGLGIAFLVGFTAYLARSWCGSARFWSNCGRNKKSKVEPTYEYAAVSTSEAASISHRRSTQI